MATPYSYLVDILGAPPPATKPMVGGTRNQQRPERQPQAAARNVSTPEEERASAKSRQNPSGFWSGDALDVAGNIFGNPIVNPIGWIAGKAGNFAGSKLGFDPVGVAQDPVGAALDAAGAPDAVQAIANPTGYITRTAVNPSTQYGTNLPRIAASGIQAGNNLVNDAQNTAGAVKDAAGSVGDFFSDAFSPRAPAVRDTRNPTAPGAGAPGTSSIQPPDTYRGLGVERPDSYRTDDVMGQLRSLFASEQRQGPSEAEALLQQATDRAAGQALGIAAGARGGAGARARARSQALSANAAMGSKASSDLAALRAREDAERRARQAQIMGLLSGAAQGADARDFGYAEADQRARAGADTLDLGYTQARSQADQAAASLANTAYQNEADREMRRAVFNASQPTGFLDDPAGSIFERLFGGPLRSPARI